MKFNKLGELENGARGPYFGKSEEETAMLLMIKLGKAVKHGGDSIDDKGGLIAHIDAWDINAIIYLLARAYVE